MHVVFIDVGNLCCRRSAAFVQSWVPHGGLGRIAKSSFHVFRCSVATIGALFGHSTGQTLLRSREPRCDPCIQPRGSDRCIFRCTSEAQDGSETDPVGFATESHGSLAPRTQAAGMPQNKGKQILVLLLGTCPGDPRRRQTQKNCKHSMSSSHCKTKSIFSD